MNQDQPIVPGADQVLDGLTQFFTALEHSVNALRGQVQQQSLQMEVLAANWSTP